jgi:pyrimidine deaminase RibD-like protein
METFINLAAKLCFESPYPEKNKRMAAVVARGGKVISCKTNLLGKHAEVRALRPHLDCTNSTVYVMRSNGRVSKPCPKCMKILKKSGVKKAVYINLKGDIEEMSI